MLVAMATGYLDHALNTTPYFRNLEQSEKVGVSFLLGEAFTHWYAQDRMKIEYLVHVAGLSSCMWTSPTTPLAPKAGASPPAAKSRPDFIGIRRAESHVFESKGRIRRPAASAVSKALGQVSAIHSVNGKAPKPGAQVSSCSGAVAPRGSCPTHQVTGRAVSTSTCLTRSPRHTPSFWTNPRRICRQILLADTLVVKLKTVSISASTRKSSLPYESGLIVNKNAAAGQPRYSQLLPTGRSPTRVGESGTFRPGRTGPYLSTVARALAADSRSKRNDHCCRTAPTGRCQRDLYACTVACR